MRIRVQLLAPSEISDEATPWSGTPIDTNDPALVAKYESYLRMLARTKMRFVYQAKMGASDVVQQAMLQAVQAFEQFRGQTEEEFMAWLRQILARHLCHVDRDLHRDKRDIRRGAIHGAAAGCFLNANLNLLAGDGPTPSQNVMLGEHVMRLAEAIDRLPISGGSYPPALHRGLEIERGCRKKDKTVGSIAGLMHGGMKTLREQLGQ